MHAACVGPAGASVWPASVRVGIICPLIWRKQSRPIIGNVAQTSGPASVAPASGVDPGAGAAPASDETGHESRLAGADQVSYHIRQRFSYTYDGPAHDLVHRLVVMPPGRHGGQVRRAAQLSVSAPGATTTWQRAVDGHRVATVRVPVVPARLDFDVSVVVDRTMAAGWPVLPASALSSRRLLAPTPLTAPSPALVDAARSLVGGDPVATARRICGWVHGRITYVSGSTNVATTAAQALSGGRGVCQDQAHVMISMCRAVGLPARYVSGHMLGEGASHAWVEVIVPAGMAPLPAVADPGSEGSRIGPDPSRRLTGIERDGRHIGPLGGDPGGVHAVAVAFDPCHDRMADLRYVTVAVGRDYQDVPPTSGWYTGRGRGTLVATQRVDMIDVAGPGTRRSLAHEPTPGHPL